MHNPLNPAAGLKSGYFSLYLLRSQKITASKSPFLAKYNKPILADVIVLDYIAQELFVLRKMLINKLNRL
jgi:hypothetical protein